MNSCDNRILKIKVFGILREKLKSNTLSIPINNNSISLEELEEYLKKLYPYLYMNRINFVLAVNKAVCNENIHISSSDEIALIPPISGG
ncbi:MAG TPA: MoaD/ThiS family protein [Nitrososphaeraceae archaeon]|nr:MoaD/ThiS family protein [Nitrososphaeraceae archaeon]